MAVLYCSAICFYSVGGALKVTIFGSGYVGLVTGACLAESGHNVMCVDIDEEKISRLNRGEMPIHEPGLDVMFVRNQEAGRLRFTTDIAHGVRHGLFQFIAVGTPPDEDGSADLQYVLSVARSIGMHMSDYRIILDKSTVPVGTGDKVKCCIADELNKRNQTIDFDVVSNPEFLKEGAAIVDFMKPDRIVVGSSSERAKKLIDKLYAPFNRNHNRIIYMDLPAAELTKYAANAMLATKISFINEIAGIADKVGADIEQVRHGIGSDSRIGYQFIYPGCGYGGSCFPKDVKALIHSSDEMGYDAQLLHAVDRVNDQQKHVLFHKIESYFHGDLKGRTIALWGLAFKPSTDDMREAPSRVLMDDLWQAGALVRAYDPVAMQEAHRIYGERDDLILCASVEETIEGADALAIVTEWRIFNGVDFENIKAKLTHPVIFDGRNLYDPEMLASLGIDYFAIGRGLSSN